MARPGWRLTIILPAWFALALAAYGSNGRTLYTGDSIATALIPVAVLLDGTVMLDRFAAEELARPVHYWIRQTPRGVASFYPAAMGVVATPFMAGPILWERWTRPDLSPAEWRNLAVDHWQKWAAAIIAALAVVVFRYVAWALGFAAPLAFALTLLFAFGSELMAVSSQSLWQHGPGTLLILGALACLVRPGAPGRPGALLLGICLGLAVAVRLPNLAFAAPLFLVALRRHPARAMLAAGAGAAMLGPQLAWNLWTFGSLLGGYQRAARHLRPDLLLSNLPGVLASPARGLLIFFPATLLLAALLAARPAVLRRDLAMALAGGIILQLVVGASWAQWWGGWSYGPRYMAELQGPLLLLLGLAWPQARAGRIAAWAALALAILVSVPIQVAGAYSPAAGGWDADPPIDQHLERLWDFGDTPYLRALRANL
ncbi:MAG: hypothetical protein U1E53_23735 [Dongiaceae bacterium]